MNICDIPFFQNKNLVIHKNIYSNDLYPSCFLVSCDLVNYKVRFASDFNPYSVIREYNALTYLKSIGKIQNIDIFEVKTNGNPKTHYLVESFFAGKSLEKYTSDELIPYYSLIVDKLSSFLHEIHSLKNDKFNSFINDNYETYLDMLNERLNRHIQAIGVYENAFSTSLYELVKKIQERIPMSNIIPSFLHFDFKPQNIIFHEETLNINVIDFEHSRFGDPLHELIRSKHRVMKKELHLQQLWSKIEYEYIKKSNIVINSHWVLFYQLYYYIAELPYLFRIKDTATIIKTKNAIEYIASNDFPF